MSAHTDTHHTPAAPEQAAPARRRDPKCQECRANDAEWAMQFIGEDAPTFYALGWHVRGFKVTKLCGGCKERRQAAAAPAEDKTRPRPDGCACWPKPPAVSKVKTVIRHTEAGRPVKVEKCGPFTL